MALLLIPGSHTVEQALPHAEAVRTPPEEVAGLRTPTVAVTTDSSAVSYRYPQLGDGHPLTVRARTSMAERQSAFLENLPERGTPELHQDVSVLAASPEVLGARLTATTTSGSRETFEASTLWYDASSGQVLPWTALFRDEQAIEQAHLALADVLREDYHMPPEQLPDPLREVAMDASRDGGEEAGRGAGQETQETGPELWAEPEAAREAALRWEGSPLEDVAFSTEGGLAVRMDSDQLPSAGQVSEVLVPVEPADAEPTFSDLGTRARDAALEGGGLGDDLPLTGQPGAPGHSLDCERLKCVALTFDDGPGEYTDELLDTLDDYDAQATFYLLGSLVGEFPEAVERMAAEGHEVGNHTWEHGDLATMSGAEVTEDVARTNAAIRGVLGTEPRTVRPPYGSLNDTVRQAVDQPLILWDVDTLDWQSLDAGAVSEQALTHAVPGSVVLFHDIHQSSVQAIPSVLEQLHQQGYHFVTVGDMFGGAGLEPGRVYTDARPS